MKLLAFWREIDAEEGHLLRSFKVESSDTRFLGDLYQDLSEKARKKYALLQTPVFVEEFILDRTLTPALDEFGLEKVRLIDPTCGSGHFLLGAFARLFRLWLKKESNEIVAAQKALDGVWGVDINPFAVAIARFRLIVAALQACGIKRLKQAPAWTIHLAAGDSLLFGSKPGWKGERSQVSQQGNLFEVDPIYAVEDRQVVNQILGQGYHVVVGNPPYITVKDKAQSEAYRGLYSTCHGQYSLGVPFTQRLWELALGHDESSGGAGYIGQITANSFMKREFGTKLIEEFFPKTDLTNVVDTSGAYIPGHGTPTVILFGRNRKPVGDTVRAVLGIKGEPTTPEDPSQGFVWQSITSQIDRADAQDEFTSTADVPRTTFATHPWSIGGGGAANLLETIDAAGTAVLGGLIHCAGRVAHTGSDEVYLAPKEALLRHSVPLANITTFVDGNRVRDWVLSNPTHALFPYGADLKPLVETSVPQVFKLLWLFRDQLWERREPNGTHREIGKTWYEYSRFHPERYNGRCISMAFVATHNHFVIDGGGKVFNRHAPIIKMPVNATVDDYLNLLGLLNSSTACFWMKQIFQTKGSSGIGRGIYDERWESFYEHAGNGLERFPVPGTQPLALTKRITTLAQRFACLLPTATVQAGTPTAERLTEARTQAATVQKHMIALQEELDWECYRHYSLLSDDLHYTGDDLPGLALGQRAFEIVMARQLAKGDLQTMWFERHGSQPITELPTHWPVA